MVSKQKQKNRLKKRHIGEKKQDNNMIFANLLWELFEVHHVFARGAEGGEF